MELDLRTYFNAHRMAKRLTRRGDLDAAAKWLRIAERELRLADHFEETSRAVEAREIRERNAPPGGDAAEDQYWDDVLAKLVAAVRKQRHRP